MSVSSKCPVSSDLSISGNCFLVGSVPYAISQRAVPMKLLSNLQYILLAHRATSTAIKSFLVPVIDNAALSVTK